MCGYLTADVHGRAGGEISGVAAWLTPEWDRYEAPTSAVLISFTLPTMYCAYFDPVEKCRTKTHAPSRRYVMQKKRTKDDTEYRTSIAGATRLNSSFSSDLVLLWDSTHFSIQHRDKNTPRMAQRTLTDVSTFAHLM